MYKIRYFGYGGIAYTWKGRKAHMIPNKPITVCPECIFYLNRLIFGVNLRSCYRSDLKEIPF